MASAKPLPRVSPSAEPHRSRRHRRGEWGELPLPVESVPAYLVNHAGAWPARRR